MHNFVSSFLLCEMLLFIHFGCGRKLPQRKIVLINYNVITKNDEIGFFLCVCVLLLLHFVLRCGHFVEEKKKTLCHFNRAFIKQTQFANENHGEWLCRWRWQQRIAIVWMRNQCVCMCAFRFACEWSAELIEAVDRWSNQNLSQAARTQCIQREKGSHFSIASMLLIMEFCRLPFSFALTRPLPPPNLSPLLVRMSCVASFSMSMGVGTIETIKMKYPLVRKME